MSLGKVPNWKQEVVPNEMQALSRARRYPLQPKEQQPPPGTAILRNSEEIFTNLYTYNGQPRGREGEGKTATQMHILELEIAWPPRASIRHLKLSEDPYVD